jgi:hypothetical protein
LISQRCCQVSFHLLHLFISVESQTCRPSICPEFSMYLVPYQNCSCETLFSLWFKESSANSLKRNLDHGMAWFRKWSVWGPGLWASHNAGHMCISPPPPPG